MAVSGALSKDEKRVLGAGLALRDQMGGHHFLQYEFGKGPALAGGRATGGWRCRDCGLAADIDPVQWQQWMRLWIAVPDAVREVLGRVSCGQVLRGG